MTIPKLQFAPQAMRFGMRVLRRDWSRVAASTARHCIIDGVRTLGIGLLGAAAVVMPLLHSIPDAEAQSQRGEVAAALDVARFAVSADSITGPLDSIERAADGSARVVASLQDLMAVVDIDGATFRSVGDGGDAKFRWSLVAVGRGGVSKRLEAGGEIEVADKAVRVARGAESQRFTSNAEGIRQSIALSQRPDGTEPLFLDFAAGDAQFLRHARAQPSVSLRMQDGRMLRMHALRAVDVAGAERAVNAIVHESGKVRLELDDTGLVYPITVSLTFTDADWTSLVGPDFVGSVLSLLVVGDDLYAGGGFWSTPGLPSSSIARWNGSDWIPMATTLDGAVTSLAWDDQEGRLIAGGTFSFVNGVSIKSLAQWDGEQWTSMGGFTGGGVASIAWDAENRHLYVGGFFSGTAGVSASNVIKWDGSSWSALGAGLNRRVHAVLWDGERSRLVVGGEFTSAGGSPANRIASWNGETWEPLGAGVNNTVQSLALDSQNNNLYAGGVFTEAGGAAASRVAMWNGTSWSDLEGGVDDDVYALHWDEALGSLLVGGSFAHAGSVPASGVARWQAGGWTALGDGVSGSPVMGGKPYVFAFAIDAADGTLFVGGDFLNAGDRAATALASWDGAAWSPLGSGMVGDVLALAWDAAGMRLFAGGEFTRIGDLQTNHIAVWNGSGWEALGEGTNDRVFALAWDAANQRLFVGGEFSAAGGQPASHIATWNEEGWSPMGEGADDLVQALLWESESNRLFAGGDFTEMDSVPVARVAEWDGNAWSALGGGIDGEFSSVGALAWSHTSEKLFVGGSFPGAGGQAALNLAVWNGALWSDVGTATNGPSPYVSAIALDEAGERVFIGGGFSSVGGVAARRVAVWDGEVWAPLGAGLNSYVYDLHWDAASSKLHAVGEFTIAESGADRVAVWVGNDWKPLGTGTNFSANTLAWDEEGKRLFVAGRFTRAGSLPARIAAYSFPDRFFASGFE